MKDRLFYRATCKARHESGDGRISTPSSHLMLKMLLNNGNFFVWWLTERVFDA